MNVAMVPMNSIAKISVWLQIRSDVDQLAINSRALLAVILFPLKDVMEFSTVKTASTKEVVVVVLHICMCAKLEMLAIVMPRDVMELLTVMTIATNLIVVLVVQTKPNVALLD